MRTLVLQNFWRLRPQEGMLLLSVTTLVALELSLLVAQLARIPSCSSEMVAKSCGGLLSTCHVA